MLFKATRLHVLIWLAYTPQLFDSSASVISSRSASSATRALNSAEWFLLFVISDRLSSQSIYLNKCSETLRPPLCPLHKKMDCSNWELLSKHLLNIACLAQKFASPFDGSKLVEATGILHDVGKARPAFQKN